MSLADAPRNGDAIVIAPTILPAAERLRILAYFGGLTVILALADPAGGLLEIPLSFYLKNRLGLSAKEAATFQAIAGIPLLAAFLFGLARDRWNLLGRRDRGLMLVFGAVVSALYLGFSFAPMTYHVLLLAMFGASLFVGGVCFFALLTIGAGAPLSFAAASIPATLVLSSSH